MATTTSVNATELVKGFHETPHLKSTALVHAKEVAWDKVYADRSFNVREDAEYTRAAVADLRVNVEAFGLTEPLEVSPQSDGRYKILKGHRRHAMMGYMRQDAMKLQVDDPTVEIPWERVPVKVVKDLSATEEVLLMIDHGQRKGLSKVGLYNAVARLYALGMTEKAVLSHLSTTRGMVTKHYRAASLPTAVGDAWKANLASREDAKVKMTVDDVDKLYSAWKKDVTNGKVTHGGGPSFREEWEKVLTNNNPSRAEQTRSIKKRAEDYLSKAAEHPVFSTFINGLLGTNEHLMYDAGQNIVDALQKVFPVEEVTYTEEGITRTIGLNETETNESVLSN